jgi:aminoglycoside phosphotransferase (APT) family kinase protein
VSSPWQPEREVSVAEARQGVRACGLAADDVRIVAAGWDNTIVLVDETWVFRFPRRQIALPGIDREIALLPTLAPRLSLPIPVPEHVGVYGDPPWRFWGARHLPGTELEVAGRSDETAVAVGRDIGRFVGELHALPAEPDLPVDPFGRADAVSRATRARDVIAELRETRLDGLEDPAVEDVLTAGDAAGPPPSETVLSHGDLYSRHVLVDEDGVATAVIDWGDLCLAPRSVDLSFAYSALAGSAREAFFAEYGSIDDDTELRARVMAIFSAASVAAYAHETGDSILLASAFTGLSLAAR